MAGLFENLDKELSSRVLVSQRLEANNSPRQAWYHVSVLEHPGGGFLIMRRSGPAGSIGLTETWFRWTLPEAMLKYQGVVNKKTSKKKGRIYSTSAEPSLFA